MTQNRQNVAKMGVFHDSLLASDQNFEIVKNTRKHSKLTTIDTFCMD